MLQQVEVELSVLPVNFNKGYILVLITNNHTTLFFAVLFVTKQQKT